MKQLLLELDTRAPVTLANFVAGPNVELLTLLKRIAASGCNEHFVYFWGAPGSGKSHLLRALAGTESNPYSSRYLGPADGHAAFTYSAAIQLYLLDDCDQLSSAAQIDAFALFNQVREHGALLVGAGALPPAQLALREDLRTRLGWGLVYQLHGLSDQEKITALTYAAEARGLVLSNGVLPYLLAHFRRDMGSLTAMLAALDRYSLETQRPITLPLLRELLHQEESETPGI